MFNISLAGWYVAIVCIVLVCVVGPRLVGRGWGTHKSSNDGPHAIERLRNLHRDSHNLDPAPASSAELSSPVEVHAVMQPQETPMTEPAAKPALFLQAANKLEMAAQAQTKVEAVLEHRNTLSPKPALESELPLRAGTKVRAICNFQQIKEGAFGIIVDTANPSFKWSRPAYVCLFANNVTALARPRQIEAFNHGYSLDELKQTDFESVLSQNMTLRAQQLLFRQGPNPQTGVSRD
jgi:hypothetical protein